MASKQELEAAHDKQERKLERTEARLQEADKTVKRAGGALGVGVLDGATGVLGSFNGTDIRASDGLALKALLMPAKAGSWMSAVEDAAVTVTLYKAGERAGQKLGESTGLSAAVAEKLKQKQEAKAG